MKKSQKSFGVKILAVIFSLVFLSPQGIAAEVDVYNVMSEIKAPNKYMVRGMVVNTGKEPKEVVLRAQIAFYDRTIAKGDVPVMVLRKDFTEVIEPKEVKSLEIPLLNEGTDPKGAVRMEPMLRVRREREWTY